MPRQVFHKGSKNKPQAKAAFEFKHPNATLNTDHGLNGLYELAGKLIYVAAYTDRIAAMVAATGNAEEASPTPMLDIPDELVMFWERERNIVEYTLRNPSDLKQYIGLEDGVADRCAVSWANVGKSAKAAGGYRVLNKSEFVNEFGLAGNIARG